jgi:hypothetical protein
MRRASDERRGRQHIWSHILRDQLYVIEEEFWACVRGGIKPDRGEPAAPLEPLPVGLAHLLVTRVHLSSTEMAALTRQEAVARMQQFWIDGK